MSTSMQWMALGACLAWLWAAAPSEARAQVECGGSESDVLIVLDRSSSMNNQGKWPAALDAIDRMLDAVGDEVRFGLQIFSEGGSNCGRPQPAEAVRVGCDRGTAAAIRRALDETRPGGGTPIGPAVDRARIYLDGIRAAGRQPYIVLITDGQGGCAREVASVRQAWDAGITTLVVGFGSGVDDDVLEAAARAGSGGAHGAFLAERGDDLDRALATIGVIVASEVCNGEDDDCDGVVDEGDPGGGDGCETGRSGPCGPGTVRCVMGALQCVPAVEPGAELCDGVDNDCDGPVDEGDPEGGAMCLVPGAQGQCIFGTEACQRDAIEPFVECVADVEAQGEQCNGLDDDCDGVVDESIADAGAPCATDLPGLCSDGRVWCDNGELVCVPDVQPADETCDGLDNDCDGFLDEVADDHQRCATGARGRCAFGMRRCALGEWVCQADAQAQAEVCDGVDDDCDGIIDEGTRDACGWCVGEAPVETCDGVDDDCDGVVDEGDLCAVGWACVEGACAERCPPTRECTGGRLCSPPDRGSVCVDPCRLLDCGDDALCVDGSCVDLCDGMRCEGGEVCHNGRCVRDTCGERGCPAGELCRGEVCGPDRCADVICAVGMFCREGACLASCAAVSCAGDERCVDGGCVADPCGAMACGEGQRCVEGACVDDPCDGVVCEPTFVCVDGFCVGDPCVDVVCERGERCVVEGREAGCVGAWTAQPVEVDPCAAVECPAGRGCVVQGGEAFCVATADGGVGASDGGGREGGGGADGGADGGRVEPPEPEPIGCACRAGEGGSTGAVAWLLVLLFGWRRRVVSAGRAS